MTLKILNYLPPTEPRNDENKPNWRLGSKSNSTTSIQPIDIYVVVSVWTSYRQDVSSHWNKGQAKSIKRRDSRRTHFSSPGYFRGSHPPIRANRHFCILMPIELWEKCQHYESMIGQWGADIPRLRATNTTQPNPTKNPKNCLSISAGRRSVYLPIF